MYGLKYTGLRVRLPERGIRRPAGTAEPDGACARIIIVGVLVLVCGVVGYIIAQRQWGKTVHWKDPSDEQPTQEAIDGAAAGRGARAR